MTDIKEALKPFADIYRAMKEDVVTAQKEAVAADPEHPYPPMMPSDSTRVEIRFHVYGGPDVGDIELEEFRDTDLTLGDFHLAYKALLGKPTSSA